MPSNSDVTSCGVCKTFFMQVINMGILLQGLHMVSSNGCITGDILVENGRIAQIAPQISPTDGDLVFPFFDRFLFPGFTDLHVHLREPGFSYKETIAAGTLAGARSGYTTLCTMPNLNPVPDSLCALEQQLALIRRDAHIRVLPYGAISKGQMGESLSDMDGLAPHVAGFSDDGRGVASTELMAQAMQKAKSLKKLIAAHCEDMNYAPQDPRSEYEQVRRDLDLVDRIRCAYHVCHVSSRTSLELIRQAKAAGLDVTCETAPHYLLLHQGLVQDDGRFKMNPPLREEADMLSLRQGLKDGTVDMIATDHAPHSAQEKAKGFAGSLNGIVGLECAFAALYTGLVEAGELSLQRLVEVMAQAPARRLGLESGLEVGLRADLTVFDLTTSFTIDPANFASLGKCTPFSGMQAKGQCLMTLSGGSIAWQQN